MAVDYYKVLCRLVDQGFLTVEDVRLAVREVKAEAHSDTLEESKRLCDLLNSGICNNGWVPFIVNDSTIATMDEIVAEGHAPELIEKVITWAVNDDFWSMNVLNPAQLHKHFQTLVARAEKASKAMEIASAPRPPQTYLADLERVRAESVAKPADIDLRAALRSALKAKGEVE